MIISNISWQSEDASEAKVTVVDDEHKVLCFAQPFLGKVGDVLSDPLFIMNPDHIVKDFEEREEILQGQNDFFCQLVGQLCDKNTGLLRIGNVYFELDANLIPGDISSGDFISLTCNRVDL